jgi:cytochrome P450
VGPHICNSEAYLDIAINYTMDVWMAIGILEFIPPWARSLVGPFLPQVRRLRHRVKAMAELLRPAIRERADNPGGKYDDMLYSLMDIEGKKYGRGDVEQFAKMELQLAFGAVRTSTMVVMNALYNLAVMPGVIPHLRTEAQEVLARHDGVFTTVALREMEKTDSFIRETMRHHPGVFATWFRKTKQPITLSTGQVIPAEVVLEVPSWAIYNDPAVYPDPQKFDAFRFVGEGEGDAAMNLFTSVNAAHLTFGYGRHACPGRFLAGNIVKMILGEVVLRYDVKMVDEGMERFENQEFGVFVSPTRDQLRMLDVLLTDTRRGRILRRFCC